MQRSAFLASLLLFAACVPTFEDLLPTTIMVATIVLLGCAAYWFLFCTDDEGAR